MSDNSTITNGDLIAADDIAGVKYQRVKLIHGADGVNAGDVSQTNGMPMQLVGLYYPASTANSSTATLVPGAPFSGALETIQNLQAAQIEVVCDQPCLVTINQYIDAAGTKRSSTDYFTIAAQEGLCENVTLPGNYFNITVTNLGILPSTVFELNTTFGVMSTDPRTLTEQGNKRIAIQEVNGELIECLESLRLAIHSLTRSIGMTMPDAAGRMRVLTDASSSIGTVSTVASVTGVTTVSTVTGVTTVSTLTNQAQVGGLAAQDQIAALMRTSADILRQSTVATS